MMRGDDCRATNRGLNPEGMSESSHANERTANWKEALTKDERLAMFELHVENPFMLVECLYSISSNVENDFSHQPSQRGRSRATFTRGTQMGS